MKKFAVLIILLSNLSFAQSESRVIQDKMKPQIFQIEKQLASQIGQTLEESLKLKDVAVRTSISVDTSYVAKKYNLIAKKNKFTLPGLDESTTNTDENLKNFNPTLQDVYSSISDLNVKVSSLIVFNEVEKRDIEKVIEDDLSTLNLKSISYNYFKSKNLEHVPESVVEKKIETPEQVSVNDIPKNNDIKEFEAEENEFSHSFWLLVGVAALGAMLVVGVFVIGYFLIKQFKNMSSSLSDAISQIDLSSEKGQQGSVNQDNISSGPAATDEFTPKIAHLFSQIKDKKHFYKTFSSNFTGIRFYVITEGLSGDDREEMKKSLTETNRREFLSFLEALADGEVSRTKIVQTAEEVSRDISLYLHDAETYIGHLVKNKIRSLDNASLKQLVEELDEADFMTLAQYSNPVELSMVLNANPDVLEKFETLEVRNINPQELNTFTNKIDSAKDVPLPPMFDQSFDLKLREFVPENIEVILNQKLGKEKTLWEELDDAGMESLYDFTLGLSPKEAATFLSILPEYLKEDVLEHLPDLKRQQIKRQSSEISRRSMELKHKFFQSRKEV